MWIRKWAGAGIAAILFCGLSTGLPAAAVAGTKTFSIPIGAVGRIGGTDLTSTGVLLGGSGAPGISINFMLPGDYAKNTTIQIVQVVWAVVPAFDEATCGFVFRPVGLHRLRKGAAIGDSSDLSGLKLVGGANLTISTGDAPRQKTLKLNPGGSLSGQLKGDSITIEMQRSTDMPGDNCPYPLIVSGIDVRYKTVEKKTK